MFIGSLVGVGEGFLPQKKGHMTAIRKNAKGFFNMVIINALGWKTTNNSAIFTL